MKSSKLRISAGNSPGTAQVASNAENVSIWWRHHEKKIISSAKFYRIPKGPTDNILAMAQVMFDVEKVTNHDNLNQYWPSSMTPCRVTRL